MAEIKILGSAAVLTAGIKLEDIVKLKKFKPETLELINEEKDVVYAISAGNGESFNKHGVCFNKADTEGNAQLTIIIPGDVASTNRTAYVKDNFGYSLLKLNTLESFISGALTELSGEFKRMEESIKLV